MLADKRLDVLGPDEAGTLVLAWKQEVDVCEETGPGVEGQPGEEGGPE